MQRSLTRAFSVPTAAARAGDFAGLGAICDPSSIPVTGTCAPFPGNRIPAGRIDPIAAALLEHVPLPSSPGSLQNLTAVEQQDRTLNQFSVRLDHRLTDADQLLARFSTFDADEIQPFGTSTLQETLVPGFGRSLTTRTRNLVASHSRVFGRSWLNEVRAGWMTVSGGQVSQNQGNPFAQQVGLLGVTSDPRDSGFPQVSTAGLYSTFGDPTVFTTRHNQHVELFDNVTVDRRRHRLKFGAYYYHLRLRPSSRTTRAGRSPTPGQFTGNALADFLLGYPTSAVSGTGRGDENGRTNWLHLYAQDDWRARDNLTFNLGLRYEFNQHMFDVNNRLSSIDLAAPGGRFVIASDEQGAIDPGATALLPLIPISYVTSAEAGWGRGLLDPSTVRLAPRAGFALALNDARTVVRGGYGIFLNQWAYSVQTAFARNLPYFSTKQVDVPADVRAPTLQTRDILTSDATGTVGGSIMDYAYNVEYSQTWSGGLQHQLRPATMAEVFYMGTWTLGADNATIRNVPEPGPGPIQARRPIRELSRINAIRFDGKSIYHAVTLKVERRLAGQFAYNVSYTLSNSKDDASSPGATESEANVPQNVRNVFDETGEWALSSFTTATSQRCLRVPVLPRRRWRGGGDPRRVARQCNPARAEWRAVHRQPRDRSRQHRRRTGSAPRSVERSEPPRRAAHAGTLVRHVGVLATVAVHVRQRAAQQREWTGLRQRGLRAGQDVGPGRQLAPGVPVGGLQPLQPGELRPAQSHLRQSQLRPDLQREETRGRCSSASGSGSDRHPLHVLLRTFPRCSGKVPHCHDTTTFWPRRTNQLIWYVLCCNSSRPGRASGQPGGTGNGRIRLHGLSRGGGHDRRAAHGIRRGHRGGIRARCRNRRAGSSCGAGHSPGAGGAVSAGGLRAADRRSDASAFAGTDSGSLARGLRQCILRSPACRDGRAVRKSVSPYKTGTGSACRADPTRRRSRRPCNAAGSPRSGVPRRRPTGWRGAAGR
jgi:hypothetical protein